MVFHSPLPIDPFLPDIIRALSEAGAVVVEAEPGAGKSTRAPAAILESGLCDGPRGSKEFLDICVLEPRKIVARLTAKRVSEELNSPLGDRCGYQVRFEEKISRATRLKFMTEGVLVRRFTSDPMLSGTGVVILDEVHERHLDTDTALALCQHLRQTRRKDLKIVVMSATMNAQTFSKFLSNAPIVRVPGRPFDVHIDHLKTLDARPLEDQVASALLRALRENDDGGDILVFLPGASEIRRTSERCKSIAESFDLAIHVLHGDLSSEEQDRAISWENRRKLILATNVAESSLTLPNVTCVIDSGLAKVLKSDPFTGIPGLHIERIPKSSAIQRSGRAGRVQQGRCFRLYDRNDFDMRPLDIAPEILRIDLSGLALTLHGMKFWRLSDLNWLDAPLPKSTIAAEELLASLGATTSTRSDDGDEKTALTPVGEKMLTLPVHPRLARMMVEADRRGFGASGALAAALLGEKDIRKTAANAFLGESFSSGESRGGRGLSDLSSTVASDVFETMKTFEAVCRAGFSKAMADSFGVSLSALRTVEKTFQKLCRSVGPDHPHHTESERMEALLISLLAAHPDRVAMRRKVSANAPSKLDVPSAGPSAEYLLCGGGSAKLSERSQVRNSEFLVAIHMGEQGKGLRRTNAITVASEIQPDWLIDLFENRLTETTDVVWNDRLRRAEAKSRLCFGKLVLSESPAEPPADEASELLAKEALTSGVEMFLDREHLTFLQGKIALMRQHFPEMNLEEMTDDKLKSLLVAHCRGKRSFSELLEHPFMDEVERSFLGENRQRIDRLFPTHITLKNGRRVLVHYELGTPPWIESRLQDFFGERESPTIGNGRLPLVMHLLAPNHRPVQVTTDLKGFWERHYPQLKPALSRRYPKHEWPDDPIHAVPSRMNRAPKKPSQS